MPRNIEQSRQSEDSRLFIDRVGELCKLKEEVCSKVDYDLRRKLAEEKMALKEDIVQILDNNISLDSKKKIRTVKDLIYLLDWDHKNSSKFISTDQEEEAQARRAFEARVDALGRFFDSISPEEFSEDDIEYFLNNYQQIPKVVNDRTLSLVKSMNPEDALRFIPLINDWEVSKLISDWPVDLALPIVQDMMRKNLESYIQKESGMIVQSDYHYGNVINSISKWPQEQQQPIIEEILENRWDNIYINEEKLFALMENWPVDKSMPYVIKALRYEGKGYVPEKHYTCVAKALANWPEDKINIVLSNQENLSWMDSTAEEKKEIKINSLYLQAILNRTEPITEEMKLRLKKGLDFKYNQDFLVINFLENHPELFDEFIPNLFLSNNEAVNYAAGKLQLLPLDKQYEFIEAIAGGFSRNKFFDNKKLFDLVSKFSTEKRMELISNLLQREKGAKQVFSKDVSYENAFYLLDKEKEITGPAIIRAILEFEFYEFDYLLTSKAREITKKIARNSQTESVIRDVAFELIAWELSNIKNSSSIEIEKIINRFDLKNPPVEIKNLMAPLIRKNIMEGELDSAMHLKELFELDDIVFMNIDDELAEEIDSHIFIRFIKYFGDEELEKLLPETISKAQESIFNQLEYDQDIAEYYIENLDKYYHKPWAADNVAKAIQQYSSAKKFINGIKSSYVWANESWVGVLLEEAQIVVQLHDNQYPQDEYEYYHDMDGFTEHDPYENHSWLFSGEQIKISSVLLDILNSKINKDRLKEFGINNAEIEPLLVEANNKINNAYYNFLEQVRSNPNINEDDKQSLINPESSLVKMTPLIDNVRAFVIRYFVQSIEGDVSRLSEIGNLINDLDSIISEGFSRYIKTQEIDVPLYDKLYSEFDNLRETGRYPLEVYLGRDGIYAYIGRRAQDVARRRKMGPEGRKKLKEIGEILEINPQYVVYPRYFRDNINYETKRQFLEQEGISIDADPLFYDTGYTGTIPEQIMKVMDFEDDDIERRIRLLSAPSVHRRVRGISENARSDIIEYIEHNSKLEEAAEGLIIDKETGKIRHIAKPTSPEEQFYFMMVKQGIARHYWLQEHLNHEPSGNINLDSEHYTIRIRKEYAKILPDEFISNPRDFLVKHGELIKGSKGEGKYPDEEVVLFKLSDGTEIVAKKIELRKAKEARKEFSILIAAKKANLPTAEPVGFLSGKEELDGSYLLMKKIEGWSGRKFEKELKSSGKYSDEQIKDILKQVSGKHKEIVDLFRSTLKIDKRWRIKDTIIEFNEETGEVESVIPIDWERAQNYDSSTPKEIDEIG